MAKVKFSDPDDPDKEDKITKAIKDGFIDAVKELRKSNTFSKTSNTKKAPSTPAQEEIEKINLEKARLGLKTQQDLAKRQALYHDIQMKRLKREQRSIYKEAYKDLPGYETFKGIKSDITGSQSGAIGSTLLSAMTGGALNPVIIKALGIDKVAKGLTKSAFKGAGNLLGKAWTNRQVNKSKDIESIADKSKGSGKQESAFAKDNEKNTKAISDNVKEIKDMVKAKQGPTEVKEEEKEEGFFSKLIGAINGPLGLAAGGIMAAAVPMLVEKVFPMARDWLDKQVQDFLTSKTGMSEGSAKGVTKLINDTLPGALLGFGMHGWKGALIGGTLGLAVHTIQDQVNEWKAAWNGEYKEPNNIGGIPTSLFSTTLAGALIGWKTGGITGALLGAVMGLAGGAVMEYGKALLAKWKGKEAADSLGGAVKAEGTDNPKDFYQNVMFEKENIPTTQITQSSIQMTPIPKEDSNGGGYGTFQSTRQGTDDVMIHNRPAKSLKSLSLAGSIDGGNSIPYIAEQNTDSLKKLDKQLRDWGYEVIYTSAMGGHKAGTGHWKGNKVDLQLKQNGRPAHLTNEQLQALKKAGYWGSGTGALGWEPVSGQVGGGHYDLYVANGAKSIDSIPSSNTMFANNNSSMSTGISYSAKSDTMPTTEENNYTQLASIDSGIQQSIEVSKEKDTRMDFASLGNSGSGVMPLTSSSNVPMSGGGNSGFSISGGDSQTSSMQESQVYAWGDVAKTAILHTL